jgi:hypothetical protein
VTISEGRVVFCNGKRGRCTARFETSIATAPEALEMAHSNGWHAPDVFSLHYCPEHRPPPTDAGLDILVPVAEHEPELAVLVSRVPLEDMVIDPEVDTGLTYGQLDHLVQLGLDWVDAYTQTLSNDYSAYTQQPTGLTYGQLDHFGNWHAMRERLDA